MSGAYPHGMEPAPELVPLVERVYRSYAAFDGDAIDDILARHPGTLGIGSAPDEWHAGYDAFAAVMRVQFQEMPPLRFDIEHISAWKEGTVGWAACRATLAVEGMSSLQTRSTFVLHEEGALWRIVQWHLSLPVANEEALGVGLTSTVDELLAVLQNEQPPVAAVGPGGLVTIMFTDIEGSTALMETLGEAKWLELVGWHDNTVKRQTSLFGGTVVKGQGDGFMLAFPASGSAAACAVAIHQAMSTGWAGIPVRVRIGMHRGNAKAEAGDFFGRTVVVAARITSAADGGEILVSPDVQNDLAGAFQLGEARSLALKGVAGNQTVFPLLWT